MHRLPLLAINHLEAHALTARLTDGVDFPYLLLLVSGGHCQLLVVEGVGRYRRLGTTLDDALGEAFDKAAKMLDLGFPGGPAVEQAARAGVAALRSAATDAWPAELPLLVLRAQDGVAPDHRAAWALEPRAAAAERPLRELSGGRRRYSGRSHGAGRGALSRRAPGRDTLVVAGGVAANAYLRGRLQELAARLALRLVLPPPRLCTDNGVMVAWAGVERLAQGMIDDLSVPARARWPLDPSAEPALGAGVKA